MMSDEENKMANGPSIEPCEYRSHTTKKANKKALIPFVISCSGDDIRAIKADKEKRKEELEERLSNTSDEKVAKALVSEIRTIDNFISQITYSGNGTFNIADLFGMFSELGDWTQGVKLDGKIVTCKEQRIRTIGDEDGRVTGRMASQAAFGSRRGVGSPQTQYLPDSMIRVTIGNISEKDILRLMNELAQARRDLGFNHKGAVFTATDCKLLCIITEFCLSHVTHSTLRETNMETLMQALVVTDVFALAACALASIYPEGYPYFFACIDAEECGYKSFNPSGTDIDDIPGLDYAKLTWFNWKKFTPARHRFLNAPNGTHTLEQVLTEQERYNAPFEVGPFNDSGDSLIRMKIKKPSYLYYREVTFSWIADITSSVDEVLNETSNSKSPVAARNARISMINQQVYRLNMQKHRAWIVEISDSTEGDIIIADTDDAIEGALDSLVSDDEVARNADKLMQKAKNTITTSMTGIPVFNCPKCNKGQHSEDSAYKSIIPRSVIADFFYITELRRQG